MFSKHPPSRSSSSISRCLLLILIPFSLLAGNLQAQQLDPSDIFFQAWLIIRDAEKEEKNGDKTKAYQTYNKAKKLFDNIAIRHPNWKPDIVKRRIDSTDDALQRLLKDAIAAEKGISSPTTGLVGENIPAAPTPTKRNYRELPPAPAPPSITPPKTNRDKARIAELEDNISKLTNQAQDLNNNYKNKENELRIAKQTLSKSQQELQQLKTKHNDQKANSLANGMEVKKLRQLVTDYEGQIKSLIKKTDQAEQTTEIKQAYENQIASLKNELKQSQQRLTQLESARKSDLNTPPVIKSDPKDQEKIKQLQNQITQYEQQVTDLNQSNETQTLALKKELTQNKERLAQLEAAHKTALNAAPTFKADPKDQAKIKQLQNQITQYEQQVTDLNQSNKTQTLALKKELTQNKERLTQLEAAHKTALNVAPIFKTDPKDQAKINQLQNQIAEYEQRVTELSQSNKEQHLALKNTRDTLKEQNKTLLQMQSIAEAVPQVTEDQKKLQDLQRRIAQIENELATTRNDRDQQAAKNRRLLTQLKAEQEKLSRAPVQAELDNLNRKLEQVTAEKEALSLSLKQSHQKLETAVTAANQIKSQREKAIAEKEDLQKHLDQERKSSNDVIRGLRAQLQSKQKLLDKQAGLLAKAYQKSDDLTRQLSEAKDVITELQNEKDTLLKERDQMANLLNLSEGDRIQQMVDQNMQLGRQLREAREAIQQLVKDNDSTNDQLLAARQNLAVAKQRILNLREERNSQDKRLAELKTKLQTANEQLLAADLAATGDSAEVEEVKMLQNVIKRQLFAQERRAQKTTLLLAQLQRLSTEDPDFEAALVALSAEEFELTDEEQKLLVNKKIDQKFVAANRATPAERRRAAAALQAKRSVMSSSAQRCYNSKRYRAARELYEMVLDVSPGHIPSLINLGTVSLKLRDYPEATKAFKNAITLRVNQPLPYAHYMLGVINYEQGNTDQARLEFDRALSLHDENAQAHIYLGNIAGLNDAYAARNHFERAIEIDATLSDPHYNLAYLAHHTGNKSEAQKHYKKLLEKGGQPDPLLETKINQL